MVKLTGNKSRTISRLGVSDMAESLSDPPMYKIFGIVLDNVKYMEEYMCPSSTEYKLRWITYDGVNDEYAYPHGGMTEDELTALLVRIRMS